MRKLPVTNLHRSGPELIVDSFAGGGGASVGIERALCRSPDVAINHDAEALAMHRANHPHTRHYATDIFEIDPRVVCRNQPVGLAWFSPDCTHHSKARGGKPIRQAGKKSRALAWVVVKWARDVRPRVILLENVEEFADWGPVVEKVGGDGAPLLHPDGTPWYVPCDRRRGSTFRKWVRSLERLGYAVEWKQLRACDYGAPTVRKRLFVIARCDGKPIRWPKPTHGRPDSPAVKSGRLQPWRTAAEIIDWSIPCPSIFLTPEQAKLIGCRRPLKENTLKRIAAGLKRYVLDAAKPFVVYCNHGGDWFRGRGVDEPAATVTASRDAVGLVTPYVTTYHGPKTDGENRGSSVEEPLRTQHTENCFGVVTPFAVPRYGERDGQQPRASSVEQPLPTVTPTANGASLVAPVLSREFGNSIGQPTDEPAATVMPGGGGKSALVQAFLAQHNTGMVGHHPDRPLSTITQRGTQQQVVAASFLSQQRTSNTGGGTGDINQPVRCLTTANNVAHVMAFLQKYYGNERDGVSLENPTPTVTTKDRLGVVTVDSIDYQIVDIGMRMLTPRELFAAQGFPPGYVLNPVHDGRPLSKSSQVRMCGNSVCPDVAAALVRANCRDLRAKPSRAARRRQLELAGV
jgi:DNA (cytosine-5)-methyltransferase 1